MNYRNSKTNQTLWRFNTFRSIGTVLVSTFVGVVFGAISMVSPAIAEPGTSATASVNVASACSLSTTGGNVYGATITGGDSAEIAGSSIKTLCSDGGGYAIYAAGFTGDTIGGENSTKLVGGSTNIDTGTGTSGDTSKWSMKLATGGTNYLATLDNGYGGYSTVPSAYTKIAHYDSANIDPNSTSQDAEGNGSILNVSYQVYISPTQLTDTYTGKVKFTLVHPSTEGAPAQPQPATPGKIVYHKNDSKAIGTMADQSASNNATVTLYPSNFSKQGYGFAGWSDKYDYATNPEANFYGPNEDIITPSDLSTKGLSLYAIWIKSEGSIQDTAKVSQVCNRLTQSGPSITKTLNSVSALTDQRDGNTYAIAKLADGKCWMIENLRLDNTAEHNSDGTLAQGYGTSATYGNFGGLAEPESANFSNSTTANSLYYSGTQSGDATINIGTSNYPDHRMPRYNNLNTSARGTNTTKTQNIYSYGNYYTWHAAIADTTHYNSNNTSVTNTSLCPTGWRLPKGGNKSNEANNEFWSLVTTGLNNGTKPANYDSNTQPYYTGTPEGSDVSKLTRNFPNNFLYSGAFSTSSASNRGSSGYYWSSTAFSYNDSYYLYLNSSRVRPGTVSSRKYNGQSIRCVAGS